MTTPTTARRRYQHERVLHRRGRAMREKLLVALEERLGEEPLHRLTIVSVARKADTSGATFYQYFPTIEVALEKLLDSYTEYVNQQLAKDASTLVEGDMFLVSAVSATNESIESDDVLAQRITELLEFLESRTAVLATAKAIITSGTAKDGPAITKALDGFLAVLAESLDRILGLTLVEVPLDSPLVRLGLWQLLAVAERFHSMPWGEYTDLADEAVESVTASLMSLVTLEGTK